MATTKEKIKTLLWALRENKKAQLWLMIGVIVLLALVLGSIVAVFYKRNAQPQTDIIELNTNTNTVTSSDNRRFIDGVLVEQGEENFLPIAVMIENLSTVRPQNGLQAAQVVYEALAEGGITRFMAVYATDEERKKIGPVRSARHYFVDWADEYKGAYMHVGGSPQALGKLQSDSTIVDVNQIGGDYPYFWRETSVPAPHNLFTSSEKIGYLLRDRGLENTRGSFLPWKFTAPSEKKDRPTTEKKITLKFSSSAYDVEYLYDRERNYYLRSNGGATHTDGETGEQIHVRNVVVQFVPTSLLDASSGRLDMTTIGEGRAVVFRDGVAIEGTWKKEQSGRTRFMNAENAEVQFIPGNIWIEVLPDDRTLEYTE